MTGRQDLFQKAMNQGHSAAWDQLWERAATYYSQALREFPDHPQALANLGLSLYEQQEYEEALLCYQKAARAAPEEPVYLEKVAQLFERIGNVDQAAQTFLLAAELYLKNRDVNKAIENWLRVTRLKPENLRAHFRLAMVYEHTGEKQKSAAEYLSAASLLQSAGDLEKAVRAVNQALQVMPNSGEAITALAMLRDNQPLPRPARPRGGTAPLRMAQVRKLEAPQALDNTEIGLDPIGQARQAALTVLAGMLFDSAAEIVEEPASRRGLQTIISGAGSTSKQIDRSRIILHLSQVVDLQTQGQYNQAAGELERAIESGLDHPAAFYDLGFLHAQSGHLDSALRYLQYAVKNDDFALGSRLLLGELLQKMDRLKDAAMDYLEALKLADSQVVPPTQADDLRQLYEPLLEAQRQQTNPESLKHLCENVSSLLNRPDWRVRLTQAREQLPIQDIKGPPIPLAEILTEARSSQVIESITNIYRLARGGNLRSAMEESFFALQQAPSYLPLHTYMGELLLKRGQLQEAISKFTMVARTYSVRGEPDRAIDLYRRVIEIAPVEMSARGRLIDQLIARGCIEEAIEELIKLANIYYSLADLEMARKTYTEALRLAQQASVDRSCRVRILHGIADLYLQSLDWRQALRVFEQIRTLQPDDEKSRSNLIELNLRLGQESQALQELDSYVSHLTGNGQSQKAVAYLEGIVSETSGRPSLRQRLADLYHQAGMDGQAIEQLDAAGEALLEAGDRKGAIQVVEAILTLNPPNRNDYQQLLAQLKG